MSTLLPRLVWAHVIMVVAGVGVLYVMAKGDLAKRPNPRVDGYSKVPEFTLIDQRGEPFGLDELKGKVWVASFIFTTCTGPCPIMTANVAKIQEDVGIEKDVRLVSFSVNPDVDTPEVLANFAKKFGATEQWVFLTGEKQEIRDIAQKGFLLGVSDAPDVNQPVTHSSKIALVDRRGMVRAYFEGTDGELRAQIVLEIRKLLRR